MTPREPSNADLLREIRGIRDIVDIHGKEIQKLKEWHIAVDAAKQALKEAGYGKGETSNKAMAAVVGVIALLTAVIVALVRALP